VCIVVLSSLLAGCGSSGTSSTANTATTSTTAAGSPICQSLTDLKTSVKALADPSTLSGGKRTIQTALTSVRDHLDQLKSTVSSGDKPKVNAVQSSIDELQTAVNDLNGLSGAGTVANAANDVGQSVQHLVSAVKAGCP
jgi:hypothetical protein